MRNILILTLIFCSTSAPVFTQSAFSIRGKIIYKFEHMYDSTMPAAKYREESIVYFSEKASLSRNYAIVQAEMQKPARASNTNASNIMALDMSSLLANTSGEMLYTFLTAKERQRIRSFASDLSAPRKYYVMKELLDKINWVVQPDQKKIGNYQVQMASAFYRGRNYTAWFCPELPYRFGPWKLQGLPGLILEAYDDKQEVVFRFLRFESPEPGEILRVPPDCTPIDEAVFEKMRITKIQLAKERMANIKVTIAGSTDVQSNSGKKIPIYNNPIDLTKKIPLIEYFRMD